MSPEASYQPPRTSWEPPLSSLGTAASAAHTSALSAREPLKKPRTSVNVSSKWMRAPIPNSSEVCPLTRSWNVPSSRSVVKSAT